MPQGRRPPLRSLRLTRHAAISLTNTKPTIHHDYSLSIRKLFLWCDRLGETYRMRRPLLPSKTARSNEDSTGDPLGNIAPQSQ